jgi:DNA-binding CsgD family transcriptional regulator
METSDGALRSVIDGAYDAALDDVLWPAWLQNIVETFDSRAGIMVVMDGRAEATHHFSFGFSARAEEDYAAEMYLRDPQITQAARLDRSSIYLDTDHIDLDDPATADYMSWQRSTTGMHHHMTALVVGPEGRRAGFSMHRPVDCGHVPIVQQERLAAIFPAIRQAMDLGFRHGEKLALTYWDGLSRAIAEPALLLDERGGVIVMTDGMETLIAAGDGLDVGQRRLRARSPAQDGMLEALIRRAVSRLPHAGAMRIDRPSGRRAFILTVHPLPRGRRMLAPFEAAALLTVIDPVATVPVDVALWRGAFDLTPREGEVAGLLAAGHSVESTAATLAMSVNTARIHLRRLLEKTGTARQSDLVRLLVRIG